MISLPRVRFSLGTSALTVAAIAAIYGMFAKLNRGQSSPEDARDLGLCVLAATGVFSYFRGIGPRAAISQVVLACGFVSLAFPIVGPRLTLGIPPLAALLSALGSWLLIEIFASGLENGGKIRNGVLFVRWSILYSAVELIAAYWVFRSFHLIYSI